MAPRTALDALIAELLGDVGLLHNEVKELRAAVPALAEEFKAAGREVARVMAEDAAKAVEQVKAASEAELARIRALAVMAAVAALLGGSAGGALVMYWLGPH